MAATASLSRAISVPLLLFAFFCDVVVGWKEPPRVSKNCFSFSLQWALAVSGWVVLGRDVSVSWLPSVGDSWPVRWSGRVSTASKSLARPVWEAKAVVGVVEVGECCRMGFMWC
jgi:hypothetical protein